MIRLTRHAEDQCYLRGIDPQKVVAACKARELDIAAAAHYREVVVVVETFEQRVYLPDGSNGDAVLACVDPGRGTVKTVMLQRRTQFERYAAKYNAKYI